MNSSYSLYDNLDKYGFSSLEQKNALETLLKQASILNKNQTIFDKFPIRNNFNELTSDILEFVNATQKRFFLRSSGQERWEVTPLKWMQEDQNTTINLLETLRMKEAFLPKFKEIDFLCILGATGPTMKKRIGFAENLFEQGYKFKKIILVSGERYINLRIDGSELELQNISKAYGLHISNLTEAHLIDYFFRESSLSSIPYHLINTPKGNLPRPTTQTTIIDLATNFLNNQDELQNLTFVSSQPTIKYQEAIITQVLRVLNTKNPFEVVGSEFNKNSTQALLEGLGSFIFAQTPTVLVKFNETISDPAAIDTFNQLFSSQPLIYQEALATNLIGLENNNLIFQS